VVSVIGRFLEHSRIFYFYNDGQPEYYIGSAASADWMSRNMKRRIELAWPIRDAALKQRVIDECLVPYLFDERGSWTLQADGQYRPQDAQGPSAQAALMVRYGESAR